MITDEEFIGHIFKQNCGDSLLVTNEIKRNKGIRLFKCVFQDFFYEVYCRKDCVIKGEVGNPKKIEGEFLQKIWPQKCGDSLCILGSIRNKNNELRYKVQFIKYPFEKVVSPIEIKRGSVLNPMIEQVEFVNKLWPQKCGDSLKIIEKSNKKQGNNYLWKCEFVNYPCVIYAEKRNIQKGELLNDNLPYLHKDTFIKYIKQTFDYKPTIYELAQVLLRHETTIGYYINKFGLKDYINYCPEGSNKENYIRKYLYELNNNTLKESCWTELDGKEIDIYIPSLKIGFEFNGNFWHSSIRDYGVKTNYHQEKTLLAKNKNIDLFHIFEYEWDKNPELIKAFLRTKLGIFSRKIYARKCEVKELDTQLYEYFCNENHLQGSASARVKLGLFYKEELIQVMSFSKPRFTDKYEWEIIRECSKIDTFILGGKEKLWSYFLKHYTPKNCISYCDFSKFNGKSYLKLGFKQERLNQPGFVWWDKKENIVYWRNPYKHQEMKNKGYLRIYDCGQLVFTWFNKDLKQL